MSEANGDPVTPIVTEVKRYAIVQTGFITESADIVQFNDGEGKRCPQIVRIVDNAEKAANLKNRLAGQVSKLKSFGSDKSAKSTPIYGVVEVIFAGKAGVRKMTEEQKKAAGERLQKARKAKGKG